MTTVTNCTEYEWCTASHWSSDPDDQTLHSQKLRWGIELVRDDEVGESYVHWMPTFSEWRLDVGESDPDVIELAKLLLTLSDRLEEFDQRFDSTQSGREGAVAAGVSIRTVREVAGLSLEDAAKLTGHDPAHFDRLERGEVANVSDKTIANAIGRLAALIKAQATRS